VTGAGGIITNGHQIQPPIHVTCRLAASKELNDISAIL
jgi:hypothetical protein